MESSWPVATAACVSGRDPGDDAHEHGLLAAHEPLEAVDVVEVVDHHGADAGFDGALEVLVGLRVAVQVDALRVDARRDRVHELAGPGDVAAQPLLGHRAQAGGTGEGLGGEDGEGVVPPRGQLVAVLARPGAQRRLVDHVGRRAELGGEVAQAAAADHEVAAAVHARTGREEVDQVAHPRSSPCDHGPVLRVAALAIAPVKGMRTVQADALELVESGPVGDRAFHVREADGEIALTMRNPRLVQVVPTWNAPEGELALAFPDGRRIAAPVVRGAAVSTAFYDGRAVPGHIVEGPFAAALSDHLGRDVQLVAGDEGVVGGDDHPVTLMSDGSLAAVAQALDGAVVDPRRFRMTISVRAPRRGRRTAGRAARSPSAPRPCASSSPPSAAW